MNELWFGRTFLCFPLMVLLSSISSAFAAGEFLKVQSPPKEQCLLDLRRAQVFLKLNAATCGLNDAQIATLGTPDNQPPQDPRCGQPLGVHRSNTQQMAYEDCYRVYVCASRQTQCSMQRIQAGMDCHLAVRSCMNENPVPR